MEVLRKTKNISKINLKSIIKLQKDELTESIIYLKLSQICKSEKNAKILKSISDEELVHSKKWKSYTKT